MTRHLCANSDELVIDPETAITDEALYHFNFRPGLYVNAERLAAMEQIDPPNVIPALLAHERIERRISLRLLTHIDTTPVMPEDLVAPHSALALRDYEAIRNACISAAARNFSSEIHQLVDGQVIRDVIAVIGVSQFSSLRQSRHSQKKSTMPGKNLTQAICDHAQNYLAGWLIAQPAAIRRRAILKTPPNTLSTVFSGNLRLSIAELDSCLREMGHA